MSRRLRPPLRRGQFFGIPLPPAAPAPAPAVAPQVIGRAGSRQTGPSSRRGSFYQVPRGQRASHPGNIRRRTQTLTSRRAGLFLPVPPATIVATPPVPITVIRQTGSRSRLILARRGTFYSVPRAQRMPHPGVVRRLRRALLASRHGIFLVAPKPPAAPTLWPPLVLRGARRPVTPIRRRQFLTVPLVGAPPAVTTRGQMTAVARQTAGMTSVARTVATMRGV